MQGLKGGLQFCRLHFGQGSRLGQEAAVLGLKGLRLQIGYADQLRVRSVALVEENRSLHPRGPGGAAQLYRFGQDFAVDVDGVVRQLHRRVQEIVLGAVVEVGGGEIARPGDGFIVDHVGDLIPTSIPGRVLVVVDFFVLRVGGVKVRHDARILPVCVCLIETQGQGIRSVVIPGKLVGDSAVLHLALVHNDERDILLADRLGELLQHLAKSPAINDGLVDRIPEGRAFGLVLGTGRLDGRSVLVVQI